MSDEQFTTLSTSAPSQTSHPKSATKNDSRCLSSSSTKCATTTPTQADYKTDPTAPLIPRAGNSGSRGMSKLRAALNRIGRLFAPSKGSGSDSSNTNDPSTLALQSSHVEQEDVESECRVQSNGQIVPLSSSSPWNEHNSAQMPTLSSDGHSLDETDTAHNDNPSDLKKRANENEGGNSGCSAASQDSADNIGDSRPKATLSASAVESTVYNVMVEGGVESDEEVDVIHGQQSGRAEEPNIPVLDLTASWESEEMIEEEVILLINTSIPAATNSHHGYYHSYHEVVYDFGIPSMLANGGGFGTGDWFGEEVHTAEMVGLWAIWQSHEND